MGAEMGEVHQADASTEESTSTKSTTAACSSNPRAPSRCLHRGGHQHGAPDCNLQQPPSSTSPTIPTATAAASIVHQADATTKEITYTTTTTAACSSNYR
jgi:hypothetical protein